MNKFFKRLLGFLKWTVKSILIGLLVIFIFNVLGVYFNLNIPVNIYTILIIGILRIPGLAILLIINLL